MHRVVITAILLAAKFFDDAYYNNAYYSKVGGVLVSEMNGLEVDFLFRINFSLHVTPDVFDKYRAELVSHSVSAGLTMPPQQQQQHLQALDMQSSNDAARISSVDITTSANYISDYAITHATSSLRTTTRNSLSTSRGGAPFSAVRGSKKRQFQQQLPSNVCSIRSLVPKWSPKRSHTTTIPPNTARQLDASTISWALGWLRSQSSVQCTQCIHATRRCRE